jgi:hypothetical protein
MAVESDRRCGNAADRDLALTADIGQIGTVRQYEAEAYKREHRTSVERRGKSVWRADRTVYKGRGRILHRHADHGDHREPNQRCEHDRQHRD